MATKKSPIESMIDKTDGEVTAAEYADNPAQADAAAQPQPSYKKFPESRIPVSKAAGTLWKSRIDQGKARLKNSKTHEAWDEAVSYYKNDQTGKRNRDNPDNPSSRGAKEITNAGEFASTENVVFSNVSALVPSIYAKNPDVSIFSPKGDEDLPFTVMAQKLIRTLMGKRTAPGINLKPKMRRSVVMTTLTNISYIEVGYTKREVAVEGTLAEIDAIAVKMENAKTPKEIEEYEGQLQALDDKVDLLQPSGPWARYLNPKDVIVDPDAQLPDNSDAKWIAIRDVFDTAFLNAVYREKDPETGQYKSIYKPDAVVKSTGTGSTNIAGHDQEITNFSLLQGDEHSPNAFGYEDERSFKRAQKTFVWKIWDRTTKRVLMYAENDMCYPIWVWDDPYGLDDFFPVFGLSFHTDPEELYARGEVSYYLDQQDEINRINSQVSRMRHRISNNVIYNKNVIKDEQDLMGLVKPTQMGNGLIGIKVPPESEISKLLSAPPVPAMEYQQLFDKGNLFQAVDRVSGVSSVVKGVEFKTNTTNKAIDSYESSSAQRLDEKIDAIEEIIGRIGYSVLLMCLQFMSQEEVAALIGEEHAKAWPGNMSAKDAQQRFSLTVTGGSSLKPTSKVRKEQAKEAGQILGQFGAGNPALLIIILKMFQRAYADEIVLEQGDWDMINQSIAGQMQQQAQPKPAPGGNGAAPQGGQQPPIDPKAIVQQISAAIQKMPDAMRKKIGQELGSGVPLEEIIAKVMEVAKASQQQQPQQRPQ